MKTLRFFLFLATALFSFNNAVAQNTMRIYRTDGTVQDISLSEIEKIDWYEKSEPSATFEDITVNGKTYKLGTSGAVDLGLSVKWATMNVGASSPGDYGDYYAWGETETKSIYNWSTYLDSPNRDGNSFTKYATDKKTVLDPEDDVAHVKWGGSWRMPTKAEQDDLRTKCAWVWTQYGGHNGYVVIGSTGNAIFLPAAGCRDDSSLEDAGSYGDYGSSSLLNDYSSNAYELYFDSSNVGWGRYDRVFGLSVRAVCP